MISAFNRLPTRRTRTSSNTRPVEKLVLKGLNLVAPDQLMPEGETPHLANSRGFARDNEDNRVSQRKRKGSRFLSTPVGESANVENVATSTGDISFGADTWVYQPFTPDVDGALTKLELEIKKSGPVIGHVVVGIYSGASSPTTLLAESSILASTVTTSYQYLPVYFMDAPELVDGTGYWILVKIQNGGSGSYYLNQTAGSGAKSTDDELTSSTSLDSLFRYKTYLSTAGEILGYDRRYPTDNTDRTYFAFGTDIYEVTDQGVATSITSTIHANAEYVRFAQVDDKLIWVDGLGVMRWYDGTDVSAIANAPANPTHAWVFKNRLMVVTNNTRVDFTALYDFENWPSVNFFYVPNPKSPAPITGGVEFQDNLHIFTTRSKHTIFGSDISSFTRKEAVGTKGAISQEAIAVDSNYIYFMAPDKMIYRYNGVSDDPISEKVRPLLQAIQNPKKVRLHIHENQLRVYFAKTPSTTATHMLLCDLESGRRGDELQWYHDTGRSVMGSLTWDHDENQLIEFSSRTGQMFLGETTNSDLGKAIDWEYFSPYINHGSSTSKDRIKRFRPILRPSDSPYYLKVGKDVDYRNQDINNDDLYRDLLVDAGGAKWGNFEWGDGTVYGEGEKLLMNKVAMSGKGRSTQIRLKQKGVETEVELLGWSYDVKSGKRR